MGIEAELFEATKIKQRAKESRTGYFIRIVEAVGNLANPEWDALSEEAQKWCNDAIDLINEAEKSGQNPKIPEFPEAVIAAALSASEPDAAPNDEPVVADNENDGQTATPAAVLRGPARNAGKSTNKRTRGTVGVTWRLKQIIAANRTITIKQLLEQLEIEGYKASENTVIGILSDFRQSLKILDEMGMLVK